MSIDTVNYIPCRICRYAFVGRTEKTVFLFNLRDWAVFEVCTTWICLRCGEIQREEFQIRENRL